MDALYLVTDAGLPAPAPHIDSLSRDPQTGAVSIQCEGKGRVFQLERAESVLGPYIPVGPIAPDSVFEDAGALAVESQSFDRVRQW